MATALQWRNLRGSFALALAPVGYVALPGFGLTFYGWALVTAGLGGACFRAVWRRDDIRAGGESNRRAHDAVGIRAWLGNRSERRALRNGNGWVDDRSYALGLDNRGGVARLPLGLRGGRHSLLIGATGTGKTTTMHWALGRQAARSALRPLERRLQAARSALRPLERRLQASVNADTSRRRGCAFRG